MFENLKKKYQDIFGKEPEILVRAPGRVNLIGEHTDYQGGYVFPIAVDRYIYCLGSRREDGKLEIYSFNYDQFVEADLKKIAYSHRFPWANYVFGVVKSLGEKGIEISGAEMLVGGDVPIGGGLSSSAALEISTATFLQKLSETTLTPLEVVKLAQKAENEFVGVSCGIMDQFSSYLCKKGHGLLLRCKDLEFQHVPLNLGKNIILLVDTKKERRLSASEYNERVKALKKVINTLKRKGMELEYLVDVRKEELLNLRGELDKVAFQRALHVVEENERVLKAVDNLREGKIDDFGNLLYQSHESLATLYEVSCEELDFIVDFSKNFEGVKGARLTGAGFGGCALVLLEEEAIEDFEKALRVKYSYRFGKTPEFYRVFSVNGAYYEYLRNKSAFPLS